MPEIHATAIVHSDAVVADDAVVGPYTIVGRNVKLGAGVVIGSHVVLDGDTEISSGTHIYPFATIGLAPQHRDDNGENGRLIIGGDCIIREHATIHQGTVSGGGITRVGDRCFLMVGIHIAHDCIVGNDVTMANNATLGGHVSVGDGTFLGGLAGIHQHVRIGRLAMIPAVTRIGGNVSPFALVLPSADFLGGYLRGPNIVGLRRNGFSRPAIRNIAEGMRCLFSGSGNIACRIQQIEEQFGTDDSIGEMVEFIRMRSARGFLRADFRDVR